MYSRMICWTLRPVFMRLRNQRANIAALRHPKTTILLRMPSTRRSVITALALISLSTPVSASQPAPAGEPPNDDTASRLAPTPKQAKRAKRKRVIGGQNERGVPGPWVDDAELPRFDNGFQYCYALERSARHISQLEFGFGFVSGMMALAALTAGTIVLSADETVTKTERSVGIAMPVVATGMTIASALLLRRSRDASELAAAAARASTDSEAGDAAGRCREASAAWNDGRSAAAAEAEEQFRQEMAKLRESEPEAVSAEVESLLNSLSELEIRTAELNEIEGPLSPEQGSELAELVEELAALKSVAQELGLLTPLEATLQRLDTQLAELSQRQAATTP